MYTDFDISNIVLLEWVYVVPLPLPLHASNEQRTFHISNDLLHCYTWTDCLWVCSVYIVQCTYSIEFTSLFNAYWLNVLLFTFFTSTSNVGWTEKFLTIFAAHPREKCKIMMAKKSAQRKNITFHVNELVNAAEKLLSVLWFPKTSD